jgi:hypothetical protein
MKKTIYVDMDGVLADWDSGIAKMPESLKVKHKEHPEDMPLIGESENEPLIG